ncbi:MAG: DUF2971 domain-containing protein [Bacteroidaceae bacterium]|nr:DUF2971 domain-containing protein [Bacteroidaceae bacterium]
MKDKLYHYTDAAGIFGMIKDYDKAERPYLTMWATNALFMNDNSEFVFGKEICKDAYSAYEAKQKIADEDCFVNGFDYENIIRLEKINSTPCIASFSTTTNNASMWEMYSNGGTGIAVQFDRNSLENIDRSILAPCIYCDTYFDLLNDELFMEYTYKQAAEIKVVNATNDDVVGKVGKAVALNTNVIPRIKHSAYRYENEHRIIRLGVDTPLFRVRKGIIVPYKEIMIPIHAVTGFIIGPTANYEYILSSLELFLASKGLSHLYKHITRSQVPYRG